MLVTFCPTLQFAYLLLVEKAKSRKPKTRNNILDVSYKYQILPYKGEWVFYYTITLFCYTLKSVIRIILLLGWFSIHLLHILKFFLTWTDACKAGIRSKIRERWGWSLSPSCLHWEWEEWSKWWEKPAAKPHQHSSAGDVHINSWVKKVICLSSPAPDGMRRGNGPTAPCCFVWYAGWLPISLTFWRWSTSTTWPKRDNRLLYWCWSKPVCPLGFFGYLWN